MKSHKCYKYTYTIAVRGRPVRDFWKLRPDRQQAHAIISLQNKTQRNCEDSERSRWGMKGCEDMVVNVQRLKEKIAEKNHDQESLAEAMGMDISAFCKKMKNGGNGFTVGDIHTMIRCIPLTKEEAMEIFFN